MGLLASAYTLAEAKEMLALWKDCYKALAGGQAKYYRIGTREFQSIDLPEIERQIMQFQEVVDELSGKRAVRVRRVVPRDL